MQTEPPQRVDRFDRLIGIELTEASDVVLRGVVPVRDELKDAAGLVHGGVYAAIAETLASRGTARAVLAEGKLAVGLSSQTSFLRPIARGTIHAVATRKHRGRTTWVWQVEIFDDDRRLCALSRMTVAVNEIAARRPR